MSIPSRSLYAAMYLIRTCEEKIRAHYQENEMKTPMHLSVGAEAIAAGVIGALREDDTLFGTYRSHGVYLARTRETNQFFGELFGRASGVAKGKAGSMHLTSKTHRLLGTSAVVGTVIPLAVGAAFAHQYRDEDAIAVVFFGDGAIDEGVFWESMNLACVKRLPVLFICEDNDLAIHTSAAERHGYRSITDVVAQFRCTTAASTSTDVEELYRITSGAIANVRSGKGPAFLHFRYYRYYEHVGINHDFHVGYRSEDEYRKWLEVDPVALQRAQLLSRGVCEEDIRADEQRIDAQIQQSFDAARATPFASSAEACRDVYATEYDGGRPVLTPERMRVDRAPACADDRQVLRP